MGAEVGPLSTPNIKIRILGGKSTERLRYGVTLSQATGLSILLTGGAADATSSNEFYEADLMQRILKNEFQIQVS